jgi:hypothetical protein
MLRLQFIANALKFGNANAGSGCGGIPVTNREAQRGDNAGGGECDQTSRQAGQVYLSGSARPLAKYDNIH